MDSNAEILKPFVDYFRKQPVLNEHFFNLCYFSACGSAPASGGSEPGRVLEDVLSRPAAGPGLVRPPLFVNPNSFQPVSGLGIPLA